MFALFFEEVQRLREPGLLLKGLVDARGGFRLLATGSSAFEMTDLARESMAGRTTRLELLPLSLGEIAPLDGTAIAMDRRREAFQHAVVVGGYPVPWLSQEPDLDLSELVGSLVLRDASDLARIQRPDALRHLVSIAARQVGSLVNLAEWASLYGIDAKTVSAYLFVLEQTHITGRVPVCAGGRRREVTSTPKVYFLDNGIRNSVAGGFAPFPERADAGPLLENWAFTELRTNLRRGLEIRYWRTRSGAEVDFIVPAPDRLVAVEVKATALRRPEFSPSAHSFVDAYQPTDFVVLNLALRHREVRGATTIHWTVPEMFDGLLAETGVGR